MSVKHCSSSYQIDPIGVVHSPFTDKFGIPRQANLIKSSTANIELYPPYNNPDAVKGLEDFSHIWLSFAFHRNDPTEWRPLIRPPRLGGNEKIGVFASRSPFRPNGLGLSLVELTNVIIENNKAQLQIRCPDLLDGTPIYDIKPYIHYADSVSQSRCAYADKAPSQKLEVKIDSQALAAINIQAQRYPGLRELIEETLAYDPRPAYKADKQDDKTYKLRLYNLDICFRVSARTARVVDLVEI